MERVDPCVASCGGFSKVHVRLLDGSCAIGRGAPGRAHRLPPLAHVCMVHRQTPSHRRMLAAQASTMPQRRAEACDVCAAAVHHGSAFALALPTLCWLRG